MKNNNFLTSLSRNLIKDVQALMSGKSTIETPIEDLGEAAKVLTAKQKKLDKNQNGKLDADDFRRLRSEGVDAVIIHSPYTPDIHGGLAEVTHRDRRNGDVHVVFENMKYVLKKGQFHEMPESIDEAVKNPYAVGMAAAMKSTGDTPPLKKSTIIKGHEIAKKIKEETEDLDEGASRSFGSAIKKAEASRQRAIKRAGMSVHKGQSVENALRDHDLFAKDKDAVLAHASSLKKIKEEVEQIDELSRKTLASYVKKAASSAANKGMEHGAKKAEADEMDRVMNRHMSFSDKDKVRDIMKTTTRDVEKPREKAMRRLQGIDRAANRLANEEVEQIDELTYDLMASPLKKTKKDSGYMKVDGGYGFSSSNINKRINRRAGLETPKADENSEERKKDLAKREKFKIKAASRLAKEEVEQIDELSKGTMAAYAGRAMNDVRNANMAKVRWQNKDHGYSGPDPKTGEHVTKSAEEMEKIHGALAKRREKGIRTAIKKLAKEDVELTQEEIDRLDAMVAEMEEIDEARGRPPKEGSEAWKRQQAAGASSADEPRQHIIQQLQRAKLSMRGGENVTFKNGQTHHISGAHAAKVLDKYAGMKPAEKETLQKEVGASHEGFKKHL